MPLLEQHLTVMIRSVRAFFNLQAGITRGGTVPSLSRAEHDRELEEARRLLTSKDQELAALRARPANNGANTEAARQRLEESPELARYEAKQPGPQEPLREDQLIWMFGHSRTGSTWLSWMMAELENQERWHEPYIGMLFGSFMYQRLKNNDVVLNNPAFIMAKSYREVWLRSIRNFVLEGAAARYPELKEDQYLVVKEPNGSIGAPLLLEATPDSRMIFLIRDPRDVIASRLDAFAKSGWAVRDRDYSTPERLNKHTKRLARDYLTVVSKVQEAYEAHRGKKTLVRYEDLRYDTVDVLKAMYTALEVEVAEVQLNAAVEKHSWENIPEDQKGKDKFFRKAQAGGWRDDLSSEQIKIVEDITGPLLAKYY